MNHVNEVRPVLIKTPSASSVPLKSILKKTVSDRGFGSTLASAPITNAQVYQVERPPESEPIVTR
jgi:hypothetical protein